MTPAKAKKRLLAAIEIPADELAVRIIEAFLHMRRPPGKSAQEVLGAMDCEDAQSGLRAAKAAMMYLAERVNASGSIQ